MDIPVPNGGQTAEHSQPRPGKAGRLERILSSPWLFVCLAAATVALAYKWYALEASLRAPVLPGWSWSAHPNTLLIYYPHTDCGCGPGLSPVLTQAHKFHLDVLVVTDVEGEKLTLLSKEVLSVYGRLYSLKNFDAVPKWSKTGNTAVALIHNGRITRRTGGTNIAEAFYRER